MNFMLQTVTFRMVSVAPKTLIPLQMKCQWNIHLQLHSSCLLQPLSPRISVLYSHQICIKTTENLESLNAIIMSE